MYSRFFLELITLTICHYSITHLSSLIIICTYAILLIFSVNILCALLLNICWDFNIVSFFLLFLKFLKFYFLFDYILLCAFCFLISAFIIYDMTIHLRSQGYKLPNSYIISSITFLFLLIGSGMSVSYLDVSNLFYIVLLILIASSFPKKCFYYMMIIRLWCQLTSSFVSGQKLNIYVISYILHCSYFQTPNCLSAWNYSQNHFWFLFSTLCWYLYRALTILFIEFSYPTKLF